jgi:hypothetical protein
LQCNSIEGKQALLDKREVQSSCHLLPVVNHWQLVAKQPEAASCKPCDKVTASSKLGKLQVARIILSQILAVQLALPGTGCCEKEPFFAASKEPLN